MKRELCIAAITLSSCSHNATNYSDPVFEIFVRAQYDAGVLWHTKEYNIIEIEFEDGDGTTYLQTWKLVLGLRGSMELDDVQTSYNPDLDIWFKNSESQPVVNVFKHCSEKTQKMSVEHRRKIDFPVVETPLLTYNELEKCMKKYGATLESSKLQNASNYTLYVYSGDREYMNWVKLTAASINFNQIRSDAISCHDTFNQTLSLAKPISSEAVLSWHMHPQFFNTCIEHQEQCLKAKGYAEHH